MIVENLLILTFVLLMGIKGANYFDIIEADVSWYYVIAPVVANLLLVPISIMVVRKQLKE
jgi:hypothetical protein